MKNKINVFLLEDCANHLNCAAKGLRVLSKAEACFPVSSVKSKEFSLESYLAPLVLLFPKKETSIFPFLV